MTESLFYQIDFAQDDGGLFIQTEEQAVGTVMQPHTTLSRRKYREVVDELEREAREAVEAVEKQKTLEAEERLRLAVEKREALIAALNVAKEAARAEARSTALSRELQYAQNILTQSQSLADLLQQAAKNSETAMAAAAERAEMAEVAEIEEILGVLEMAA